MIDKFVVDTLTSLQFEYFYKSVKCAINVYLLKLVGIHREKYIFENKNCDI